MKVLIVGTVSAIAAVLELRADLTLVREAIKTLVNSQPLDCTDPDHILDYIKLRQYEEQLINDFKSL